MDNDYQHVFTSDLLDSDCTLSLPTNTSAITSATTTGTSVGAACGTNKGGHSACDGNIKGVLESLLLKVTYLEREISRISSHERRFDHIDMEMARQNRLDKMEKDIHKMVQNTSNLQTELRSFSVDLTSRIKQVEVYPTQPE